MLSDDIINFCWVMFLMVNGMDLVDLMQGYLMYVVGWFYFYCE